MLHLLCPVIFIVYHLRFPKHGLALPIPISWQDISDKQSLPYLKPSDFMSHFAEHDLVGKLAGNVPQEQVEDNLLSFWRSYSKEFPGHQVFGGSQPLRRTIPCYLHGDEGRRYKKSGVMIVSLQTILGQSKSKKVSKKHLKQSQTLNLRGHSFSTRFLLMAIPRRYYANQSEVYLSVFEAVIRDLLSLQNEGFEYDGSMWRVQVLGLKAIYHT